MANDVFSTLKVYLTKIGDGEMTPAEMGSVLNTWVRESGESIKTKVEEEVQASVAKMGFIKRGEFDALAQQVETLKHNLQQPSAVKKSAVKKSAKTTVKKVVKK